MSCGVPSIWFADGDRLLAPGQVARQAEVGHARCAVGPEQHVGRLEVAVQDPPGVRRVDGARDSVDELEGAPRRQRPLSRTSEGSDPPSTSSKTRNGRPRSVPRVVHVDDPRVPQARERPRLAQEALDAGRVGVLGEQQLERARPAKHRVEAR